MSTNNCNCSRCNDSINNPVKRKSNYVTNTDLSEPTEVEVVYAVIHTDETLNKLEEMDALLEERNRDSINAEMAHPDADKFIEIPDGTKVVENEGGMVETAAVKEVEFSISIEDFEHVEVDDPHLPQKEDEVALTYTQIEERNIQKTGIVCPDCTKDDDEIIWGVDK